MTKHEGEASEGERLRLVEAWTTLGVIRDRMKPDDVSRLQTALDEGEARLQSLGRALVMADIIYHERPSQMAMKMHAVIHGTMAALTANESHDKGRVAKPAAGGETE